jgi:hypothetical protein
MVAVVFGVLGTFVFVPRLYKTGEGQPAIMVF